MARTRPTPPAALLSALRRMGAPAGEITRYWSSEATALTRGFVALLMAATTDLVAGLTLGQANRILEDLPGLLVLIPGALAMRGATFGALGARLGTAIHTGQFERDLTRGGWLWRQIETVFLLTGVMSMAVATVAKLLSEALGLNSLPLTDLIAVSMLGGFLASLVMMFITVSLARTAWKRDWNMDDVGAPTITAAGDLLAIPALLVASEVAQRGALTDAVGTVLAVVGLFTATYGVLHPRADVRRTVRESIGVLSIAATLSVIAGLIVESRVETFRSMPALLVMFPGFIAMFGALGGILASRLTSKLHLGLLEPHVWPRKAARLDISSTYLLAVVMFTYIGATTWGVSLATGLEHPALGSLVAVAIVGGLLGTTVLAVVAYSAATATYRFGLDPDNHAIPIVSSTMDFLGMLCLVASLALLQVG